MNNEVREILELLEYNGYEAYVIGGFVRDYLLGLKSKDVDICTNADPRVVARLFNSSCNKFGCVSIKFGKLDVEITTFRKDIYYNKRWPKVEFVDSLKEDVLRRDFTINAIAMNKNGEIIDLLGGIKDLKNSLIKAIDDSNKKMEEDPLRIMRAIRLSTVLNFEIDKKLIDSIKEHKNLVSALSKYRIMEEMDKILTSRNFLKGLNIMQEIGILEVLNISYEKIKYVPFLDGMWAQLKVLDIPFTKSEKSNIIKILDVVKSGEVSYKSIFKYGEYVNIVAGKILGISDKNVNKMINDIPIRNNKDIDITIDEVKEFVSDKEVKEIYREIADLILNKELENRNETIKKYLKGK